MIAVGAAKRWGVDDLAGVEKESVVHVNLTPRQGAQLDGDTAALQVNGQRVESVDLEVERTFDVSARNLCP